MPPSEKDSHTVGHHGSIYTEMYSASTSGVPKVLIVLHRQVNFMKLPRVHYTEHSRDCTLQEFPG